MSTQLPQPIAASMQAANAHDTQALLRTLTVDAVVTDEGRVYHGHEELREWSHRTNQEYQATLDVTEVTQVHEETVVTAQVAGTFDGSPIQLRYHFTLSGDKIATLAIR
jgi:ketosteroid isomerase-like protein